MQRTPWVLIPNEGYEIGWVKARPFFNQPLPPTVLPDGSMVPTTTLPNQNPTNEFPWVCRGYPIPIPANINGNTPLLLEDNTRSLLIIQNNSSVSVAGDVAPNLLISLDGPVHFLVSGLGVNYAINALVLVPGEGLLMDTRVLGNALYFAWGPATNTGGSVITYGICIPGRTLNSPPLPGAGGGDISSGFDPGRYYGQTFRSLVT
jgi:hypothetical protein